MKTRRSFIKNCLLASTALPVVSSINVIGNSPLQAQQRKIIIVGAGLAGLTCAYELSEAGYNVQLLEALDRPGGKVRTLREGFEDGQYAEGGGVAFFPVERNYAKEYIEKFNLKTTPTGLKGMSNLFHFNGQGNNSVGNIPLKFPLTDKEVTLGVSGMREKYVRPITDKLWTQLTGNKLSEADRFYDTRSMAEAMMQNGASPEAVRLLNILNLDYVGEGPEFYSAADMIAVAVNVLTQILTYKNPFIKILGGNDLLPQAFTEKLRDKIQFSSVVSEIYQDKSSVNISYTSHEKQSNLKSDFVVLAVPPSAIKNIKINDISYEKTKAISNSSTASISRIYFQTKTRVWNEQGLSGDVTTDLPITYLNDYTSGQEGTKGIIQGYMMGKHARHFQRLQENERIEFALKQFEILFPGISGSIISRKTICWDEQPFNQGAYCFFKPGDIQNVFPHLAKREGRIIFAGAHTASRLLHNSMQGALESGIRASNEIKNL